MNKIMKLMAAGCLSSTLLLTGCIEETFPTNAATEDQVTSSNQAAAAMLWISGQGLCLRSDYLELLLEVCAVV